MLSTSNKIIFLQPPKSGSTSLTKMIESLGLGFSFPNESYWKPKIHLFLSEIVEYFEIENLNDYKIIQVTRNPYYRFCSGYFHLMKLLKNVKTSSPVKNMNFNEFTNHVYSVRDSKDLITDIFVDTLFIEKFIEYKLHWGGSRVFFNQVHWNDLNREVNYIKLEDISYNTEPLQNLLNSDIPKLPLLNRGSFESYEELLTSDIKEKIGLIYSKDFETLNYIQ